jgi:DNA-binding response OmpR family regulator
VLLIDDSPDYLAFMTLFLGSEGFQVASAPTGTAALAWLAAHRPDLIILDLWLPDMDGDTLLAHLDADTTTRTIPVVIYSGAATQVEEVAAQYAGPHRGVMLKPFDMDAMLGEVRRLLAVRRPVEVR